MIEESRNRWGYGRILLTLRLVLGLRAVGNEKRALPLCSRRSVGTGGAYYCGRSAPPSAFTNRCGQSRNFKFRRRQASSRSEGWLTVGGETPPCSIMRSALP